MKTSQLCLANDVDFSSIAQKRVFIVHLASFLSCLFRNMLLSNKKNKHLYFLFYGLITKIEKPFEKEG